MTTKEKEKLIEWVRSVKIPKVGVRSEKAVKIYTDCLNEIELALAKATKKAYKIHVEYYTGVKGCAICGIEKRETDFYAHKQTRDGLSPYCKICANKKTKDFFRANNYAYQKEYKKKNPNIKAKCESNYQKSDKGKMAKMKRDMVNIGIPADQIPNEFLETKLIINKIKNICKTSQNSETRS